MNQAFAVSPRCWSIEAFERFWSNPNRNPEVVPQVLTTDIIGHWPGCNEPARGRAEYMHCITSLIQALPDVRLAVDEYAVNDDFVFVRWTMRATGTHGPFEISGIDRVRIRNGQVCENIVVFDTAAFQARSGMSVPWL